jgi:hypothetical protein
VTYGAGRMLLFNLPVAKLMFFLPQKTVGEIPTVINFIILIKLRVESSYMGN